MFFVIFNIIAILVIKRPLCFFFFLKPLYNPLPPPTASREQDRISGLLHFHRLLGHALHHRSSTDLAAAITCRATVAASPFVPPLLASPPAGSAYGTENMRVYRHILFINAVETIKENICACMGFPFIFI